MVKSKNKSNQKQQESTTFIHFKKLFVFNKRVVDFSMTFYCNLYITILDILRGKSKWVRLIRFLKKLEENV